MNLPNALTLLRIFFVPVLIVVLLTRSPNIEMLGFTMHFEFWGVLILLTAATTDMLDGYLARRWKQVTTVGTLLDPVADKLLISAASGKCFQYRCGISRCMTTGLMRATLHMLR